VALISKYYSKTGTPSVQWEQETPDKQWQAFIQALHSFQLTRTPIGFTRTSAAPDFFTEELESDSLDVQQTALYPQSTYTRMVEL